jgi:hypothetical protein
VHHHGEEEYWFPLARDRLNEYYSKNNNNDSPQGLEGEKKSDSKEKSEGMEASDGKKDVKSSKGDEIVELLVGQHNELIESIDACNKVKYSFVQWILTATI